MEKCDGTVNQVGIPSKFLLDRYSRECITSLLFSSHLKCAVHLNISFLRASTFSRADALGTEVGNTHSEVSSSNLQQIAAFVHYVIHIYNAALLRYA